MNHIFRSYSKIFDLFHFNKKSTSVKNRKKIPDFSPKDIFPFIQPIVGSHDKKIVGAEVLLRIKQDDKFISPSWFIGSIEESSKINYITIKLINDVYRFFKPIVNTLPKGFYFSFNITAKQIRSEHVRSAVLNFKAAMPEHVSIVLEVVERSVLEFDDDVLDFMEVLVKNNVKFAIDDFGNGSSTFKYLEHTGFSILKIDRDLTLVHNGELIYKKLIAALVVIAERMNLQLTAEGVENEEQHELLEKEGVQSMQGYYYSRPITMMDFNTQFMSLSCSAH